MQHSPHDNTWDRKIPNTAATKTGIVTRQILQSTQQQQQQQQPIITNYFAK